MPCGGSRPNTGGKRAGAGRKKSATTRKTRKIADQIADSGEVTPLEVMVEAMRRHYRAKRWDMAAAIAKDCAPYIHPRLSAIAHGGKVGVELEIVEALIDGNASQNAAEGGNDVR